MFLLTSHYLLIILKMIPYEIFQNLTGQIMFCMIGGYLPSQSMYYRIWFFVVVISWILLVLKCHLVEM